MKKQGTDTLEKGIERDTKSEKTPDNIIEILKEHNARMEKALADMEKYSADFGLENQDDLEEDLVKLNQDIERQNQGVDYAYGPLNKSEETKLFEQIVDDIITDRQNKLKGISGTKPEVKTRIDKGTMFVIRDGEEVNINELLKKVNLNHVKLTDKALQGYETIYENDPELQNDILSREDFDERLLQSDIHQRESLGKLSYAEKISINIYTGINHEEINGILRGLEAPENFDRYLMDIAVSSQGLNSLPTIELPTISRMQDKFGLDDMISLQENHGVEEAKGFISTSYKTLDKFGDVQIIYKNIRGVSIDALSEYPDEREYLIPPSTQVRYTGHKIVNDRHIFTAQGANVLLDQSKEASPVEIVEKEINSLVEQTEKQLAGKENISTEDAESYVKKIIDINTKHGVINEAEKDLYFKKDNQGESAFKRDAQSLKENSKTSKLRDKLLQAASSVFEKLGFKKLVNIFREKISDKPEQIIHKKPIDLNNATKDIRKRLSKHTTNQQSSIPPTQVKSLKGKKHDGISM